MPEYLGVEKAIELIKYTDEVYLEFGADGDIHGEEFSPEMKDIRRKAIEANLKLVHCRFVTWEQKKLKLYITSFTTT